MSSSAAAVAEQWAEAEFPSKILDLFNGPSRYRIAYGGRGAGRSWGFARMALALASENKMRILCARETQESISQSVHRLLSEQIAAMGLSGRYNVLKSTIIETRTGSEFIFSGLRNNVHNIKSLESVDVVWAEEAQNIQKDSWDTLIPTIRKPNSEIWISFNPNLSSDNTYVRFVLNRPPTSKLVFMTWRDNPWFPAVLDIERKYLKEVDPEAYKNVWEGQCKSTVTGAIYADELAKAETDGRVCVVPYDGRQPVFTFWDLGYGDRVSIWFAQLVGMQWRFLDYYANSHKNIDFYLQRLQGRGYTYGTIVLPWDGDTPELGSGVSISSQMRDKGFKVVSVPQSRVHVGVNAVRTIFPQLWFDQDKCTFPPKAMADKPTDFDPDYWGLAGLRRYQWGEAADSGKERKEPLHDLASHPADALRTFAMWLQNPSSSKAKPTPAPGARSPWS